MWVPIKNQSSKRPMARSSQQSVYPARGGATMGFFGNSLKNRALKITAGEEMRRPAQGSVVDTFQQKTWLGYLAFVRILVGVQFFMVGWPKLTGGRFLTRNGQGLAEELLRGAPKDYLAWHRAFI